jgi:hypothetical protein
MKPKLVAFPGNNNLTVPLVEKNIRESFDFISYDSSATYDKSSTVFVVNQFQYYGNKESVDNLISNGYKFIFENLHEANLILPEFINHPTLYPNVLCMFAAIRPYMQGNNIVQVPMYFWYCESKSWSGMILDYRALERQNQFEKKFLLMMHFTKPFRTHIYNKFSDQLNQSLHSYVGQGIRLDGDTDRDDLYWDRYINIDWYNKTQFSVVVETWMNMGCGDIFITEKSMKPFALKHPFISLSCANTVSLLKQSGFESFENLFDESYDSMDLYTDRIDWVYNQVKLYARFETDYDLITKQKLEHNYNWFYNSQEVDRRYKLEVTNPILEFINA